MMEIILEQFCEVGDKFITPKMVGAMVLKKLAELGKSEEDLTLITLRTIQNLKCGIQVITFKQWSYNEITSK